MRLFAAIVLVGLLAAGAPAQPLEAWLPDDTLFLADFDDLARLRTRWSEGYWSALWQDPLVRRYAHRLLVRARIDWETRGKEWPGPLLRAATGRALVAVVRAGAGAEPVLLLEMDERGDASLRRRLRGRRRAGPVVTAYPDARREARAPARFHFAARGSVLVVAWDPAVVHDVARGPRRRSLARDPVYRLLRARTGDADVRLYLPPAALRDLAGASSRLDRTDLGGVRGLGAGIDLRPDGLVARAFLYAPDGVRGLPAMIARTNGTLASPASLPGDTQALLSYRVDRKAVRDLAPEDGDAARRVVRALAGEFTTVRVGGRSFVVARADGARLRRVLDRLAPRRPELGVPVYSAPDGSGLGVFDDHFVAARDVEAVRALVRRSAAAGDALEDAAAYRRAVAPLPARRILFWYEAPPYRPQHAFFVWVRAQAGTVAHDAQGLRLDYVLLLR